MEAFLFSISTVAIAEMGDRTQLLALVNHAIAGLIGAHAGKLLTPARLDAVVGLQ